MCSDIRASIVDENLLPSRSYTFFGPCHFLLWKLFFYQSFPNQFSLIMKASFALGSASRLLLDFFAAVLVSVGTPLFVIDVRFGLIPLANWGRLDDGRECFCINTLGKSQF